MTVRSIAKSLLALLVVALSSYALEVRLHRGGVPSRYLILLSSFLVGLVAGVLVHLLSIRERQRRAYVECRLRVIAEMNHHIRNALQVIVYRMDPKTRDSQELRDIRDSVDRIDWALREILPAVRR